MSLLLALAGCVFEPVAEEPSSLEVTAADLWDGGVPSGTFAVLEDVVVTSPRGTQSFFVQGRGGGPRSGVRIDLGDALNNWPPPIGTPIRLWGRVLYGADGPVVVLYKHEDAILDGEVETPVVVPWSDDPALAFALVEAPLEVLSNPDPAGRADSTGPGLAAAFGVLPPPWGTSGTAVGVYADGALSLRSEGDWSGDFVGEPPISTDIDALVAGGWVDGTPVHLVDVLQAAPWSRGGRWTVLQDGDGDGIWVDAEGWGVSGAMGERGDWWGEVRTDGEGLRLRVWTDPVVTGAAIPIADAGEADGHLIGTVLTGLEGPDGLGDWSSNEGWIADDRFVDLSALGATATVLGAVRTDPQTGARRLAILEVGP